MTAENNKNGEPFLYENLGGCCMYCSACGLFSELCVNICPGCHAQTEKRRRLSPAPFLRLSTSLTPSTMPSSMPCSTPCQMPMTQTAILKTPLSAWDYRFTSPAAASPQPPLLPQDFTGPDDTSIHQWNTYLHEDEKEDLNNDEEDNSRRNFNNEADDDDEEPEFHTRNCSYWRPDEDRSPGRRESDEDCSAGRREYESDEESHHSGEDDEERYRRWIPEHDSENDDEDPTLQEEVEKPEAEENEDLDKGFDPSPLGCAHNKSEVEIPTPLAGWIAQDLKAEDEEKFGHSTGESIRVFRDVERNGLWICPPCRKPNHPWRTFCPGCGIQVSQSTFTDKSRGSFAEPPPTRLLLSEGLQLLCHFSDHFVFSSSRQPQNTPQSNQPCSNPHTAPVPHPELNLKSSSKDDGDGKPLSKDDDEEAKCSDKGDGKPLSKDDEEVMPLPEQDEQEREQKIRPPTAQPLFYPMAVHTPPVPLSSPPVLMPPAIDPLLISSSLRPTDHFTTCSHPAFFYSSPWRKP